MLHLQQEMLPRDLVLLLVFATFLKVSKLLILVTTLLVMLDLTFHLGKQ